MGAGWLGLSLGMAGIGAPPTSAGIAGAAYLDVKVAGPVSFAVGAQEGAIAGPARIYTGIHADLRWDLAEHVFLKGGFVHQHETALGDYEDDALLATIGASRDIHHRTGGDLGAGLSWALPTASGPPLAVSLSGSAVGFPDEGGPQLYAVVESLMTITL